MPPTRFAEIDGIDQQTADRFEDFGGIRNPQELVEFTADGLADSANVSPDAAQTAIESVGGDADVGLFESIVGGSDGGEGFDGGMSDLDPVGFERQNPNGKFAPENTRPDPSVPADRAPDGRFVSKDRTEIESFGRADGGMFSLFD